MSGTNTREIDFMALFFPIEIDRLNKLVDIDEFGMHALVKTELKLRAIIILSSGKNSILLA